jgi:lysophospholipase L1-like esterase
MNVRPAPHVLVAMLAAVSAVLIAGACGDGRSAPHPMRLACLGDSNTFALQPMTPPAWCELLATQLPDGEWQTRSYAFLGATVSGEQTASFASAADHIAKAEADWHPNVYILAYGTNDVKRLAPAEIVAAYAKHRDALVARGLRVLVATTPPELPPAAERPAIAELNALLRRQIPARDLVDFDTIVEPSDYDVDGRRVSTRDGIHLNLRGQEKRAQAARAALLRP